MNVSNCWLILIVAILCCGCSRTPKRLVPPDVDVNAAQTALEQYDASGDGSLSEEELENCPPLKSAIARIDQNGDRKIEPREIDARIAAWKESRVGMMPVTIRLNVGGRPLADADVKLVPEAFLGEEIKSATGKTNRLGVAVMRISEEPDERGVYSGFYRIVVSKMSSGKESIPARYNSETQLGIEIEPASPDSRDASFNLAL